MFGATSSFGETLSPLEQTKQGTPASEVTCKESFVLMVRESGKAACLTPISFIRSVDRGWGIADLDLMEKHPKQLEAIVATILANDQLRKMVIDRIMENPEAIEKIKENEKLMSIFEGKGMIEDQAGSQMGGMFGDLMGGLGMGDTNNMEFPESGKAGGMLEKMVRGMMGSITDGMADSPKTQNTIRTTNELMDMMFK